MTSSTIADLLAPLSLNVDPHETLGPDARDAEQEQWIAHGAHPYVQRILSTFPSGEELGKAAIEVIKVQLALRGIQIEADRKLVLEGKGEASKQLGLLSSVGSGECKAGSLLTQTAHSIAKRFGQSAKMDQTLLQQLKSAEHLAVFRRATAYWIRLPFPVLLELQPADGEEIDEWIISNERFMRALLSVEDAEFRQAAAATLTSSVDLDSQMTSVSSESEDAMWKAWLVKLGSPHAEILFGKPDEQAGHHAVERPQDLPGLCLLGQRREASIRLRTAEAFRKQWHEMTCGVLQGLDWSNTFVGGGIVMGALTGGFGTQDIDFYKDSDIDLYIYGLTAEEATAKVLHIEEVFAKNIGSLYSVASQKPGSNLDPEQTEPAYAVLRNSKTITLIPHFPYRRVQIILKICHSPMETLLNFDLDQVAMGFDGVDPWMLPRAARALKTGYSTFTMDLIQGHYLNDRRATQDVRLFKYASRGYGLRFLPAYVDAVRGLEKHEDYMTLEHRESIRIPDLGSLKIAEAEKAPSLLHVLLDEARNKVDWFMAYQDGWDEPTKPHSILDSRQQFDAQKGRATLSSFENFALHVSLHELDLEGAVTVSFDFADTYAEEDPQAYYDGPEYKWDENFSLLELRAEVKRHGLADARRLFAGLTYMGVLPWGEQNRREDLHREKRRKAADENLTSRPWLQRAVSSSSVAESLEQKLVSPLYAPNSFLELARAVLPSSATQFQNAIKEASRPDATPFDNEPDVYSMVYWESPFRWQLTDRLEDEVIEMLSTFRKAQAHSWHEREKREKDTLRQISRRAPRPTRAAELTAFKTWTRQPNAMYYGGPGGEEGWEMLRMHPQLTATRFALPWQTLLELQETYSPAGYEDEDRMLAWWRASLRKKKGLPLPYSTVDARST